MSAWMCSDALIKNVAINVLLGQKWSANGNPVPHLAECSVIATMLRDANVASLVARYGRTTGEEMAGGEPDQRPPLEVTFDDVRTWERMSFVQQAKNIACFDYQACEVDDYEATKACMGTRAALSGLVARQPGYDKAGWGEW